MLFALALAAVLAACGSGADAGTPDSPNASGSGASAGSDGSGGSDGSRGSQDVPQRIVSLSPSGTEILYAVGAGDQVVAVDEQSDYPDDAPTTDLSGYTPNVEAILRYDPDLVVFTNDPGDLASSLDEVGVPHLRLPAPTSLEEAYEQYEQVGVVTGHPDKARDVADTVRSEVSDAVDEVEDQAGDAGRGLTYYHEVDDNLYSVTSDSFIGQVYSLFGLENIADDAGGKAGDYPQLQGEYIVSADPDLIFLADAQRGGASAESVAQRPGWAGIDAVEDHRIYALDGDVTSRWSPRIGDLAEKIGSIVAGTTGEQDQSGQ